MSETRPVWSYDSSDRYALLMDGTAVAECDGWRAAAELVRTINAQSAGAEGVLLTREQAELAADAISRIAMQYGGVGIGGNPAVAPLYAIVDAIRAQLGEPE